MCQTGSFGWNVSSGEIYWSDGTYKMFEYDRTAKPTIEMAFQRVHPDDRDFVRQAHERAINDKTDFNIEHRLLMPDGRVKHCHVLGHALQTSSGDFEFVGAGTYVTAANLAEEKIRTGHSWTYSRIEDQGTQDQQEPIQGDFSKNSRLYGLIRTDV